MCRFGIFTFTNIVLSNISAFAQKDLSKPPDFTIVARHTYRGGEMASIMQLEKMLLANPVVEKEPMFLGSLYGFDEKSGLAVLASISFYSSSKECLFDELPAVDFVVDDETVSVLGKGKGATQGGGHTFTFPQIEDGMCNDAIDVFLPISKYIKVASAKRHIKVRAGKLRFELTRLHIAALNEMARRIKK